MQQQCSNAAGCREGRPREVKTRYGRGKHAQAGIATQGRAAPAQGTANLKTKFPPERRIRKMRKTRRQAASRGSRQWLSEKKLFG